MKKEARNRRLGCAHKKEGGEVTRRFTGQWHGEREKKKEKGVALVDRMPLGEERDKEEESRPIFFASRGGGFKKILSQWGGGGGGGGSYSIKNNKKEEMVKEDNLIGRFWGEDQPYLNCFRGGRKTGRRSQRRTSWRKERTKRRKPYSLPLSQAAAQKISLFLLPFSIAG